MVQIGQLTSWMASPDFRLSDFGIHDFLLRKIEEVKSKIARGISSDSVQSPPQNGGFKIYISRHETVLFYSVYFVY